MRGRIRRVLIEGSNPGVMIADEDPPLLPGEVEIDLSSSSSSGLLPAPQRAALDDLLRTRRG